MRIGIIDGLNECNFAVVVADNVNIETVEKCLVEGLSAWYQASNEDLKNDFFNPDEMRGFYYEGYSYPTSVLLSRFGIKHDIEFIDFDDNDNAINLDKVIYY